MNNRLSLAIGAVIVLILGGIGALFLGGDDVSPTLELDSSFQLEYEQGDSITLSDAVKNVYDDQSELALDDVDISDDALDMSEAGSYTVTFSVKDEAGNEASDSLVITVLDTEDPVITFDESVSTTLEVNNSFEFNSIISFVSDNVTNVSLDDVVIDTTNADLTTLGNFDVTYTLYDARENSTSHTKTFTVVDTESPLLVLQSSLPTTIELGSEELDLSLYVQSVNDNYDSSITATYESAINYLVLGSYDVVFKAVDSSNNETTQTLSFTVVDTQSPVIELDTSVPTALTLDDTEYDLTTFILSVSDNYDSLEISDVTISHEIDITTEGTYTVDFELIDSSDNEVVVSIEIDVVDAARLKQLNHVGSLQLYDYTVHGNYEVFRYQDDEKLAIAVFEGTTLIVNYTIVEKVEGKQYYFFLSQIDDANNYWSGYHSFDENGDELVFNYLDSDFNLLQYPKELDVLYTGINQYELYYIDNNSIYLVHTPNEAELVYTIPNNYILNGINPYYAVTENGTPTIDFIFLNVQNTSTNSFESLVLTKDFVYVTEMTWNYYVVESVLRTQTRVESNSDYLYKYYNSDGSLILSIEANINQILNGVNGVEHFICTYNYDEGIRTCSKYDSNLQVITTYNYDFSQVLVDVDGNIMGTVYHTETQSYTLVHIDTAGVETSIDIDIPSLNLSQYSPIFTMIAKGYNHYDNTYVSYIFNEGEFVLYTDINYSTISDTRLVEVNGVDYIVYINKDSNNNSNVHYYNISDGTTSSVAITEITHVGGSVIGVVDKYVLLTVYDNTYQKNIVLVDVASNTYLINQQGIELSASNFYYDPYNYYHNKNTYELINDILVIKMTNLYAEIPLNNFETATALYKYNNETNTNYYFEYITDFLNGLDYISINIHNGNDYSNSTEYYIGDFNGRLDEMTKIDLTLFGVEYINIYIYDAEGTENDTLYTYDHMTRTYFNIYDPTVTLNGIMTPNGLLIIDEDLVETLVEIELIPIWTLNN